MVKLRIDKYYNQNNADGKKEQHVEHEPKVEEKQQASSNINLGIKFDALVEKRYLLILIAILIIIINIVLRMGLLRFEGLFEPDGFFYYSVIRQAVNSNYVVSNYLDLSGFPSHNFIGEAQGLPYLTVITYFLIRWSGLSLLTVMRWMPILFGVLYAILAYFLAKKLSNSRALGLLAMFFVSVASGNIARTAGMIYRGDSFISLFILLALLFMVKCFEANDNKIKRYLWAVLSAVSLSLGVVVWNGAPFIIVVYMLALLLAIIYGFIKADHGVLLSSLVLSITLLLMHILQIFYVSAGIARPGLQLVENDFFILYVPILLGSIATYYLVRHIHKFMQLSTVKNRIAATLVSLFVLFIIMFALFGGTIINIASPISPILSGNLNAQGPTGTNVSNKTAIGTAVTQTTQELQKPSYDFLWSSFSVQLWLSIIGVALFLLFAVLTWKGERFIKRDHFNLNILGFIAIIAYFMVTAYLQYNAIRFNAIISLPLSIFAAFAVYAIGKLFYHYNIGGGVAIALFISVEIIALALIVFFLSYLSSSLSMIVASAIAIIAILALIAVYSLYALIKGHIKVKYAVIAFVLVILIYNFYNTYVESYTAVQADGVNPNFLSAMTWLKGNTPTNATVLALWPDGSVVEGWGLRQSYMDSVGGENSTRIYPFSRFLFNTSPQTQYLYSVHKPQYLVVRSFWYEELGGIAQEGLVQNATAYGYVILPSLNITRNSTAQFFTFQTNTPPFYKAELVIAPQTNGTNKFSAYLGVQNGTRLALLRSIIFYNTSNYEYSIINTSNANTSINYTLMISFVGHVINGAYVLGPKLIDSNVFKFTFLCNTARCPYDGSNVTLTNVYSNSDTKIFKINYLR